MTHCQLFDGRPYQYGPSLCVQKLMFDSKSSRSVLVYYPLGSGKTLAALHAARVFLVTHPKSKVIVLTTKTNIDTSWKDNLSKYKASESFAFKNILVKNVDWWFSEENKPVAHYNRLIRLLVSATGGSRRTYMSMRWTALVKEIKHVPHGSKSTKPLRKMRKFQCATPKKSFLDLCCPKDYFLVVDECQQYVNTCGKSVFVQELCKRSAFSLLLSATPLDDSSQHPGLCRMMGTCHLDRRILYVPVMKHQAVHHRYMGSQMSPDEWQEYVLERSKRQDAYLSRSRQFCNATSKWRRIFRQIVKDNASRTVVYSFFRERGADGFFDYACAQDSSLEFRLFKDTADMEWFHSGAGRVLIITSRAQTGISLMGVDAFHIMEPQWSASDEDQAIGRATRIGSRECSTPLVVYHWIALASNHVYVTADESVRDSMVRKKARTDRLLASLAATGARTLQRLYDTFGVGQYLER